MKKYILVSVLMLLMINGYSQVKSKAKDKAPTQKEMQDMMKEAQGMMDEAMKDMSPEDKKMMDSMGIKMPDMKKAAKDVSGISDKQLATAWEDENRVVPKKDAARIAAIPKNVTSAQMGAYITSIQKKLLTTLDSKIISISNEIFTQIKSTAKNNAEAGNMATAFWLSGQPEIALYMLGKICVAEPSITDNTSNYASMLSMLGAQHLAIPVLNNLNAKYPKNSTLLNNLGQAWFGLGEISKAEKYLDSAIRIYAYHPQANLTKAAIEESKGNISKAIEAVKKSIRHSHSDEKENRLKKLGYKLTLADVRLPFKPSADPLGLGRFRQPDYPISVSELMALKPQWEAFDSDCDKEIDKLRNELAEASVKHEKNLKATMAQTMQAINNGGTIPASAQKPIYATKALLVLEEVVSHNEIKMKNLGKKFIALGTELDQLQKTRKRAAPEAPCEDHIKYEDEYLNRYNGLKQAYNNEFLKVFKLLCNDVAYWSQYTSTDEVQFEIIKLGFKIGWLEKLKEYRPLLTARGYELMGSECVEKKDSKPGKLAEFDDIACQYKSKINFGLVVTETNCSHSTTTYNLGKLKYTERELGTKFIGGTIKLTPRLSVGSSSIGPIGIEAFIGSDVTIELDENKDVKEWSGTVTAGIETGVGISKGPIKAGASITEAIEVEIGSNGIGDVNIVTKAEASVGIKVGPVGKSVEIGVEDRMSLISWHGSVTATGAFGGMKISEW